MEFPDVGKHCAKSNCNKLDFLPVKCDICSEIFCDEHYPYQKHNCVNSHLKDNQVPACPLCNKPIPISAGQDPNTVVGAHIDSDCQFDPAKKRQNVFTNKCSFKGCKVKEVIPVVCHDCKANFCLKHRHPQDHKCGSINNQRLEDQNLLAQKESRLQVQNNHFTGNLDEDEALARALALSLEDNSKNVKSLTQEEIDLVLARELQASEYQGLPSTGPRTSTSRNNRDNCNVL